MSLVRGSIVLLSALGVAAVVPADEGHRHPAGEKLGKVDLGEGWEQRASGEWAGTGVFAQRAFYVNSVLMAQMLDFTVKSLSLS